MPHWQKMAQIDEMNGQGHMDYTGRSQTKRAPDISQPRRPDRRYSMSRCPPPDGAGMRRRRWLPDRPAECHAPARKYLEFILILATQLYAADRPPDSPPGQPTICWGYLGEADTHLTHFGQEPSRLISHLIGDEFTRSCAVDNGVRKCRIPDG
jgi:hypothetical protein